MPEATGNTSDASDKNNCPCSNNQRVNCSALQDGGENKGLGMTLFTSADCFKKRRESGASPVAVSRERENERDGLRGRKRRRKGEKDEVQRESNSSEGRKRVSTPYISAGRRRCRDVARLHYWPGLKSILEAIVCNTDEKAAR